MKLFTDADAGLGELYQEIIRQELNVKEIEFLSDMSELTSYSFKPQLRILGQKYGKRISGRLSLSLTETPPRGSLTLRAR